MKKCSRRAALFLISGGGLFLRGIVVDQEFRIRRHAVLRKPHQTDCGDERGPDGNQREIRIILGHGWLGDMELPGGPGDAVVLAGGLKKRSCCSFMGDDLLLPGLRGQPSSS